MHDSTAMKLPKILHFFLLVGMAFLCANCDSPELRQNASEETVPQEEPETIPEPAPQPVVEKTEKPEPKPEPVFVEPTEPYFKVERKGSKIIVEGAIRSQDHQERIVEQLTAAFTNDEIVSNLEVDYDRHPVPWTGRVTEELLIPFLREVEDAYVEYNEGNITLKGTLKNGRMVKPITETAINTFSSAFSKGIDNQLKVKGQ